MTEEKKTADRDEWLDGLRSHMVERVRNGEVSPEMKGKADEMVTRLSALDHKMQQRGFTPYMRGVALFHKMRPVFASGLLCGCPTCVWTLASALEWVESQRYPDVPDIGVAG